MILILFLSLINSKASCEVGDGLRLVEFYKGTESDLMEPKVNLISKITETSKLPFEVQKINCGLCDCQGVKDFPSFHLVKNHQVLDSFTGYKSYDDLFKFILKSKEVDLFKPSDVSGKLIELKEKDFYSSFDGPWLILFYHEDKKEINTLLKQVLKIFKGRIKIGKVKHSESKDFITRYQIKTLPTIYGMYEGLNVPFLGQIDLQNLIKFTNRLIEPAFLNLNYNELLSIARDSEPVYVVLHQNENLANETFLRYAHNFKFKTRLFKSEDPEIFKRVGVKYYHGEDKREGYYHGDNKGVGNKVDYHGDKKGDYNKGDYHGEVNHKKEGYEDHFPHNNLNLVVFKNGHFHLYDGNVHNEGTLIEWLFHTHFPNVTKISDSTFHSIFNGIKPVFLLLTENDFLTQNLERFAKDVHLGKPFYHLIFSSINLDEFMLFTASLLPKIEIPTIVIYNPKDKKFYHKKNNLNEFNFKEVAEETLKLFDQGKLKVYGSKNYEIYYLIGGLIVMGVIGCWIKMRRKPII